MLKQDSVVNKLEIKPETEFEDWLYQELASRFNYSCVPFKEFQKLQNAITMEGQIKAGWKRHEKDDRRRYVISGNMYLAGAILRR